ncbi:hypothetical protein [Pseudomonas fildesensis]|nr:hypothetical protein [Pseudomonas fildesensis]
MGMLVQGHIVKIGLDNCTLQRMEELPANPSRAAAEAVGLLPLVEFLERAPGVALTAMGTHEMPENRVAKAKRAYENFCATFWPSHRDDVEASHREFDEASTDRWVEFTELGDGARCTYGLAYVALLQMQNIRRTYPSLSPEEKFEAYLHSMAGMLDLVSAFELEIAKYAFWDASHVEIDRLPGRVRRRRADIKENFTKQQSTVSKCKRAAFNGAMDLYWLSGANLLEDLGVPIKTDVGEFALDNWVGTNDLKLYRICRDLHSTPHEGSKTMRFACSRESALGTLRYWRNVDRMSKNVMLYRNASGYRSLDSTLLSNVDAAVKHLERELRKVLNE